MSLIADGLLILTCLTTALYCHVLNRRLQRLANTDQGIGEQIKRMNEVLAETQRAQRDIHDGAKAASDKLLREITASKRIAKELKAQLDDANEAIAKLERARLDAPRGYAPEASVAPDPQVESDAPSPSPQSRCGPDRVDSAKRPAPPAPVPEPAAEAEVAPSFADDDLSAAEMDLQDILDTGTGEQQLGFLPDIDVRGPDDGAADDFDDDDFDVDDQEASFDDNVPAEPERSGGKSGPTGSGDKNLLKVERVAL